MQWLKQCYSQPLSHPRTSLMFLFCAWRIFLLLIALASPGVGYDTSTDLLIPDDRYSILHLVVEKLTRWDAIYFTTSASRGYVYEQERAFARGFPETVSAIARLSGANRSDLNIVALTGIGTAHVFNLLSVLSLYELGGEIFGRSASGISLSFNAACLHIIAPAGLFLSAPYAESLYSFLSFAGAAAYASSFQTLPHSAERRARDDISLLASGMFFGAAALVRSNGLFNGLPYLHDAVLCILDLRQTLASVRRIRYTVCVCIAGSMVGIAFIYPQYVAYLEFCTGTIPAAGWTPWCTAVPPSIYTYIQSTYWGVGFLRYWTFSNLPLFLMAAPGLSVLECSGITALTGQLQAVISTKTNAKSTTLASMRQLAIPQIVVASLALTSYHVQVITRLASAYPIMYLWLATEVNGHGKYCQGIVRWMVIYALIQGGLFASFLPPA